jgi:hypothetical protein
MTFRRAVRIMCVSVVGVRVMGVVACRPSDVLSVPAPAGVLASPALQSQAGAEAAFNGPKAQLFNALETGFSTIGGGLIAWTGLLTDEFTYSGFSGSVTAAQANIDARQTVGTGRFVESGDIAWQYLGQARSGLLVAIPGLLKYEPTNGRSKIGEAYALAGYAELLLAEGYCAGTPLDEVLPGGRIQNGMPLSTDSLFAVAETHFDSALAEANGDVTVVGLASVGLGRALLNRGRYPAAAAAVAGVPTSLVYEGELEPTEAVGAAQGPNLYAFGVEFGSYRFFNVADQEGVSGLNFASARDPRLVLDTSTYQTPGGSAWRLPIKFESNLSAIPLASGIEARLIQAEAALASGDVPGWTNDLNALRADSSATHIGGLSPLTPDSTLTATAAQQVNVMFRERAFWLFGTGTRLGDLRRLIRQYGRDPSTVFPTGAYANGSNPELPVPIPVYGTDVNLTLPTSSGLTTNGMTETNPNYKGCIAPTSQA